MEDNMEYCCDEPNLCYVHLVKSGIAPEEAVKIVAQREKAQAELIPKIGPLDK